MEILLTLTYVAICIAIFKIFRIPVNQWTLVTAALGGIFGLALLFMTMAYNQPFSTNARIYYLKSDEFSLFDREHGCSFPPVDGADWEENCV